MTDVLTPEQIKTEEEARTKAIKHHAVAEDPILDPKLKRLARTLLIMGMPADRAKRLIDEFRETGYCRIDSSREFGDPHVKLPVLPPGPEERTDQVGEDPGADPGDSG